MLNPLPRPLIEFAGAQTPHRASLSCPGLTDVKSQLLLLFPANRVPVASKVVVPPVVSLPKNSSPMREMKPHPPETVQLRVSVAAVVFGAIAPKIAPQPSAAVPPMGPI